MLPDKSVLIGQKLVENETFLIIFNHCVAKFHDGRSRDKDFLLYRRPLAAILDLSETKLSSLIEQEYLDKLEIFGRSEGQHFGNGDTLVFNPKSNRAFKRAKGQGRVSCICVHQINEI